MSELVPHLKDVRVPTAKESINKEECSLSFDTPDSPEGIFVCLKTFSAFSRDFVEKYHHRTGARLFLRLRRLEQLLEYELVLLPKFKVFLLNSDVPDKIMNSVHRILRRESLTQSRDLCLYSEFSTVKHRRSSLLSGPGLTGLVNLGNTCYVNSILQVLLNIPEFVLEFNYPDKNVQFERANLLDPTGDVRTQLTKLVTGMQSGLYSCINPHMFVSLIAKDHPEFSSKRQQDAQEFLLYVINKINNRCTGGSKRPTDIFNIELEERKMCGISKQVRYSNRTDYMLTLPVLDIPLKNQTEYDDRKKKSSAGNDQFRPIIDLNESIKKFAEESHIDDFYSSAIKSRTFASSRTRIKSFPEILILHINKLKYDQDNVLQKIPCDMNAPDELDLSHLRACGIQTDEQLLPEEEFVPDVQLKKQLTELGYNENAIFRALYHQNNGGLEAVLNWLQEHQNDSDLYVPFVLSQSGHSTAETDFIISDYALDILKNVGILDRHARLALKLNCNNAERALDWVCDNVGNLDELVREHEEKNQKVKEVEVTSSVSSKDEMVIELTNMGIEEGQARLALQHSNYQLESALKWLELNKTTGRTLQYFLEQEKKDKDDHQSRTNTVASASPQPSSTHRPARYRLMGMVSHIGPSAQCGHYVAYIRKQIRPDTVIAVNEPRLIGPGVADTHNSVVGSGGGASVGHSSSESTGSKPPSPNGITAASLDPNRYQWVIFNDSKVAISEKPPTESAYLYFYKRMQDE